MNWEVPAPASASGAAAVRILRPAGHPPSTVYARHQRGSGLSLVFSRLMRLPPQALCSCGQWTMRTNHQYLLVADGGPLQGLLTGSFRQLSCFVALTRHHHGNRFGHSGYDIP